MTTHIGFHVCKTYCKNKNSTIEQNIQEAIKQLDVYDTKTFQIFVAIPTGWHFTIKDDQIDSLKEFIKTHGIHLYAHARYVDNLFSSAVKSSTLGFIKKELILCCKIGIRGFIVHLYRYPPTQVIESLKVLNPPPEVKIFLETPAISPSKAIYNTPQALIQLWVDTKKANINTGICVDTCHIYSSGENIGDINNMKTFFNELIKCIPSEDLLIHLNDSSEPLGSGRDRHASLGKGLIWGTNTDSLKWLLQFIKKHKIDSILERNEKNGSISADYQLIKDLNN